MFLVQIVITLVQIVVIVEIHAIGVTKNHMFQMNVTVLSHVIMEEVEVEELDTQVLQVLLVQVQDTPVLQVLLVQVQDTPVLQVQ
jgi:hypothetical protein